MIFKFLSLNLLYTIVAAALITGFSLFQLRIFEKQLVQTIMKSVIGSASIKA